MIRTLSKEPGFMMWDMHNEPLCTSYVFDYQDQERKEHIETIWKFVRHYCEYFKEKDPENPITVGIHWIGQVEDIGAWCDVLSFHDYSPSEIEIQAIYEKANQYAKDLNKPVFCSEMCCTARANPYDVAIETAMKNHTGYVLWELMVGCSFWNDRHGIVYPDGTIRDAAAVAAIQGFFRNRGEKKEVNLETEEILTDTVRKAEAWLAEENPDALESRKLLQRMANLLECGELVPMADLPSAKVRALRLPEEMEDAKDLVLEWLGILNRERRIQLAKHAPENP